MDLPVLSAIVCRLAVLGAMSSEEKAHAASHEAGELLLGERAALMAVNAHLIDKIGHVRTEGAGFRSQVDQVSRAEGSVGVGVGVGMGVG